MVSSQKLCFIILRFIFIFWPKFSAIAAFATVWLENCLIYFKLGYILVVINQNNESKLNLIFYNQNMSWAMRFTPTLALLKQVVELPLHFRGRKLVLILKRMELNSLVATFSIWHNTNLLLLVESQQT